MLISVYLFIIFTSFSADSLSRLHQQQVNELIQLQAQWQVSLPVLFPGGGVFNPLTCWQLLEKAVDLFS